MSQPVDCPICGRKVKDLPDRSSCSGTVTCPGCRTRLHYDWNWKAGHVSIGKA